MDVVIDEGLARRLVDGQFPQWAGLKIAPVALSGVDNRTYRLGSSLSVRLPAGEWYALQVEKEQRWLPELAPLLPLPIPAPVALGVPGCGYPFAWSVYEWLPGEPAASGPIDDLVSFARDLAAFLVALRGVDLDGPAPGRHNFFRGGPLSTYADETIAAIAAIGERIDGAAALACWQDAIAATWEGDPVWFHGDVAVGNLLVRDGRLAAVIDFGSSGVGDPACDVVIAWTLFSEASRDAFRVGLDIDRATWSRGRGWALWKALITYDSDPRAPLVVERVLDDHASRS